MKLVVADEGKAEGKPEDIKKKTTEKEKPTLRIKPTQKRITKPLDTTILTEVPIEQFKIGDEIVGNRIPSSKQELVLASSYYMNNREIFIQFINGLLNNYKDELISDQTNLSCENRKGEFSLLTHQKIVRDYINAYTPYRGTLLYHGLGSGKTCSSIAVPDLKQKNKLLL